MTEHETFLKLITSLEEAAKRAQEIGIFRPDQVYAWTQISDLLTQVKDNAYALAMKGVLRNSKHKTAR